MTMSKRDSPSIDISTQNLRVEEHRRKRQQNHDIRLSAPHDSASRVLAALNHICDHGDELIERLQRLKQLQSSLKKTSSQDQNLDLQDAEQQLVGLSTILLPDLVRFATAAGTETALENPEKKTNSTKEEAVPKVQLLAPMQVAPWTSADIISSLPPLPVILDAELAETVFLHPAMDHRRSYERLEWLGDAYLELISSLLISKTFIDLSAGRCSQIRERLIRNVTLAGFFREYGLESRARLPSDISSGKVAGRGRSNDKDLTKTQADMFEAYVAAVILSDPQHGVTNATTWLKALWARTLDEDLKKLERQRPLKVTSELATEPNAKQRTPKDELSIKLVVAGVKLSYDKIDCSRRDKHLGLPMFSVGVHLSGWGETRKLLGVGTALSVKEAGQKAAAEALLNKKLIGLYEKKKKAFLEAREVAEAASQNTPS